MAARKFMHDLHIKRVLILEQPTAMMPSPFLLQPQLMLPPLQQSCGYCCAFSTKALSIFIAQDNKTKGRRAAQRVLLKWRMKRHSETALTDICGS